MLMLRDGGSGDLIPDLYKIDKTIKSGATGTQLST
jgi:hypothetical protein